VATGEKQDFCGGWVAVPHFFFDKLPKILPAPHWRVLLWLWRELYGRRRQKNRKGAVRAIVTLSTIEHYAGVGRTVAVESVNWLIEAGLIWLPSGRHKGRACALRPENVIEVCFPDEKTAERAVMSLRGIDEIARRLAEAEKREKQRNIARRHKPVPRGGIGLYRETVFPSKESETHEKDGAKTAPIFSPEPEEQREKAGALLRDLARKKEMR
jgi:hypothetical protein